MTKKKMIAVILAIVTLMSILGITSNASQMAHYEYKDPIGTTLYDIYIWNEDPSNPSSSEPYKLHTDMDDTASYYSFAVVFASIRRYDYSLGMYVDTEKDAVIDELTTNHMMWDWSVSGICDSIGDSVTDGYTDSTGRDTTKNVYARANIVIGDSNGSGYTYYKVYPGGGIQSRTYFSYSFTTTYSKKWN